MWLESCKGAARFFREYPSVPAKRRCLPVRAYPCRPVLQGLRWSVCKLGQQLPGRRALRGLLVCIRIPVFPSQQACIYCSSCAARDLPAGNHAVVASAVSGICPQFCSRTDSARLHFQLAGFSALRRRRTYWWFMGWQAAGWQKDVKRGCRSASKNISCALFKAAMISDNMRSMPRWP